MVDDGLLAALQDPDPTAFRRYVDARLIAAMMDAVRAMNEEEDTLIVSGNPDVPPLVGRD